MFVFKEIVLYSIASVTVDVLWLVPDMDACEIGHSCQHICVSSGNSYHCKCPSGFVLNDDMRTCSIRGAGTYGHGDGVHKGDRNKKNDGNQNGEGSASEYDQKWLHSYHFMI